MLAYAFLLLAIGFRFVTPLFGFTPMTAALLYFGAKRPRRELLWAMPLLAAGDLGLNFYVYHYPFTLDLLVSWAWYAAMMLGAGAFLKGGLRVAKLAGASLAGSISFFFLSNLGVWLSWHMYPMTLAGLATCYAAAVPFFRYAPAGDLLFTAVLFGMGALVEARHTAKAGAAA